jgi:hypothetical protein
MIRMTGASEGKPFGKVSESFWNGLTGVFVAEAVAVWDEFVSSSWKGPVT